MVIVSLARLLVAALAVGAASAQPPGVQPPAAGGKYGFKRDWYAAPIPPNPSKAILVVNQNGL